MPSPLTKPNVFIIESLSHENEQGRLREGKLLSEMLHLAGKESKYYYIRTRNELEWALELFRQSKYRYLHISCHADHQSMATTLDDIEFLELGPMLNPFLHQRRLFLSACSMASLQLAKSISVKSGYRSILGPSNPVDFHDAAIFWASFYHRMFSLQQDSMSTVNLIKVARVLSSVFDIELNCYYTGKNKLNGKDKRFYQRLVPKPLVLG